MLWEHDRQPMFPEQYRSDTLEHHGVPGMHWGEITKEYQKKGYDHRYDHTKFKNKQSNMVAKIRRRREAQAYQNEQNRLKARKLGKSVGDNFFYKARQRKRQDELEAYRRAHPQNKKDVIDKTMDKVTDHFGLREYSKQASDFIKEQGKNMALDHLKKKYLNKGPTEVSGSKTVGKILSKPIGAAGNVISKGAYKMSEAMSPINAVKNGTKFIGKTAYKTAKFVVVDTPKNLHKGIKWLENGGYQKIRSKYASVRNAAHKAAGWARNGASFISRVASKGSRFASIAAGKASGLMQRGGQIAQKGATFLQSLLRKRNH